MSAADELASILKDAGMLDFMDDARVAYLAQDLLERGIRTPIQIAPLVTERNASRMERNQAVLEVEDLKERVADLQGKVVKLSTTVRDYESSIDWNLTCLNCAKLMDQNYEQYHKLETVKDKLTEVLAQL